MKQVRFLKNSTPYNAGEVAGFSDAVANGLISRGMAAPVEKKPEVKESRPERTKELKPEQTKGSKSEE